ncbi:L-gulonolactone/D-arabinono-1,4-lactone oxidase [Epithele typhae]|uniref:L-gulonolactone/D-arabinono-1,4-lactone oxidase n=1 Tax=Epithele typhae TaxID=378194 RepID=UPI002008EB53|nr:L-gulonolactone/D-arabinono-1,4-lactone oxidase [Epithele typhae]KAH9922306.1 L-gulonolactone/D-arabinono-1,4-lactone oxidase [Epithele typhae]
MPTATAPALAPPAATNLKLASMSIATLYELLQPITVPASAPRSKFVNWGLSFACAPLAVFEPTTAYECELVLELARRERRTVRAAGVGHSPSDLACTTGFMMRTEKLSRVLEVNHDKHYVVAEAGIILNDLHVALADHGLAMINLGSISDQTLAGVITTATHGTGLHHRVLSDHVLALTLLLPDGSRVRCSREQHHDLFMASICGLGATGIILDITMRVRDAFRLKDKQHTVSFDDFLRDLRPTIAADEFVRFWWFPQADAVRVSAFEETDEVCLSLLLPATSLIRPVAPVTSWLWQSLVGFHFLQLILFFGRYIGFFNTLYGRISVWLMGGPSVSVDDSHKIFNLDCKYPQYTTEWGIPHERTEPCLRELRDWLDEEIHGPNGSRPHCPLEIRFSCPDDIWLSPSNGQTTCWIGIMQYKPYGLNVPYRKLFARFEQIMLAHGGKPHWAKAHPLRPAGLRAMYPRFDDFVRVLTEVDPRGLLRNPYVDRHIFGDDAPAAGDRVFKREH